MTFTSSAEDVFYLSYDKDMMKSSIPSYDRIAKQWKDIRDRASINQCIVDIFPLFPKHPTVLDVGCGTGYPIASWLSKKGCKVTGIDGSKEMIKYAKDLRLNGAEFNLVDIVTYKPTQTYDVIIAFDSLFHLNLDQQKPVLTTLLSALKFGGIFLMTHGKKHGEIKGEMFGEPFFYSSLAKEDFVRHLESMGMRPLIVKEDYQEITTGSRDLLIVAQRVTK